MKKKDKEARPVGETLPTEQRVYRMRVVQAFLAEGIPLAKVDGLRDILEELAFRLTTSSHLAEFIPMILEEERKAVSHELAGRPTSLIFDGTTRLGEAIAIVTRFVGDDWSIKQRLIRLRTVSMSVNAPELAQVLNHCVATQYQIPGDLIYASMRDRASVNGAAIRSLALLYPNVIDVTCFSHTLNNAGRHFNFPLLNRFCRLWISLFSHSARAKLVWKTRISVAIKTHSETRWWTKWEVLNQVSAFFGDVRPLLQENQEISPTTTAKLLAILDDDDSRRTLQLQLAALVDIGKHLVEATYLLEGDGPLLFSCYEMLQSLVTTFSQEHRPNL